MLRVYLHSMGEVLLIYLAFSLIERLRPAERGQPLRAAVFNVQYLLVSQLIVIALLPLVTAFVVGKLRAAVPGAFGLIHINSHLEGLWKTFVLFFIYDFFYYWFHRLQHTWPFLWSQHKLHHSEVALNATTTLRHHWLEDPLRVVPIVLPMAMLFDLTPPAAGIATFIVGLWPIFIHANLRVPLGPLSRVLTGPQVHRIHHSIEAQHVDHNYAAFFPLWDQLFGTYFAPARHEYPRTGLVSGERVTSITQAMWLPFGEWFARRK